MSNGTDKTKKSNSRNILVEKALREYADTIYRIAFQYIGNTSDAEDIFQDVSVTLVTSDPPFDDDSYLRNWLCKVTVNKCKNYKKKKYLRSFVELDENIPSEQGEKINLSEEMKMLPVKYRTVLYLYYYEDFSIEEISRILSVNPNTVGSQLRRGREKLKKILTEGE